MRAGAATALRGLQASRASRPSDPCVVMFGAPEARERVRLALGGHPGDRRATEDGCVRSEVLDGLVLIEPPESLQDATEATEVATFLRGLQHAHGLVLAVAADGVPGAGSPEAAHGSPGSGGPAASALAIVTEFFTPRDWQPFVSVALVGGAAGGEVGRAAAIDSLRRHHFAVDKFQGNAPPRVFCVTSADQAHQFVESLRAHPPVPCEPLQAKAPLLAQYHKIRQQLSQRRPHNIASSAPASDCSGSPGSPSSRAAAGGSGSSTPSRGRGGAAQQQRQWTVMVFGKTGAGKSHLANLLVGHRAFASGDSLASVTGEESVRRAASQDGALTVLDTIGFGDTRLPPEAVVRSLRDTALEAPGGIDALLFVLKKERVSAVEQETLAYVTQLLFGPDCLPNLYMVVTHAGRLAKDVDHRAQWLSEQAGVCPPFAGMLTTLGANPLQRIAFVENSDPADAEDKEDRALAERRRLRALADIRSLLEQHRAPPYRHGIMRRAGELQNAHLEEMRRELRGRIEAELRQELDKDRGELEEEKERLHAEVAAQRQNLKEQEEEFQQRFETEWTRMRAEFTSRARTLARGDLEPMAKEIVEQTEKKEGGQGRRCVLM